MKTKMVPLGDIAAVSWGDTSITKASYVDAGAVAFSASGPDGFLPHAEHNGDGIVLSAIGARCGRCFFASGQWTAIKNTITITTNQRTALDLKYYWYFLNRARTWPIRGGGQPFIGLGTAREVLVPLPPLSEQNRIAGILDQADGLRRKRQQALALTDQFLRSTFLDLFGDPVTNPKQWPVVSLTELGSISGGFAFKSDWFTDAGRKVIRISNIQDGAIDTSSAVCINDRVNPVSSEFTARGGDVLMALSGATTGKLGVVSATDDGVFVNQRIAIVRANTPDGSVYLSWVLKDTRVIESLLKTADGSAQANLSPNRLRECRIPRPSDATLHTFHNIALQTTGIATTARHSLRQAEQLFDSLVQRAFRGEL